MPYPNIYSFIGLKTIANSFLPHCRNVFGQNCIETALPLCYRKVIPSLLYAYLFLNRKRANQTNNLICAFSCLLNRLPFFNFLSYGFDFYFYIRKSFVPLYRIRLDKNRIDLADEYKRRPKSKTLTIKYFFQNLTKKKSAYCALFLFGAGDGNRTRGNQLGKLTPYH